MGVREGVEGVGRWPSPGWESLEAVAWDKGREGSEALPEREHVLGKTRALSLGGIIVRGGGHLICKKGSQGKTGLGGHGPEGGSGDTERQTDRPGPALCSWSGLGPGRLSPGLRFQVQGGQTVISCMGFYGPVLDACGQVPGVYSKCSISSHLSPPAFLDSPHFSASHQLDSADRSPPTPAQDACPRAERAEPGPQHSSGSGSGS